LLSPRLPQTRALAHIPPNIILTPLIPRIPLLMRLRRAHTTLGKIARLVHLPCSRIDAAALALGNGAVVAGARAVFDRRAGELGRYGFVDAGVGSCGELVGG
jgi:hypothetical protein